MLSQRVKILFIFIAFVTFARCEQVFADKEIPDRDYSVITSNDEFIFVMFISDEKIEARIVSANSGEYLPSSNYTSILNFLQREGLGTNKELRAKYPCSGLYRNDGSDKPIWTVNWYAQWVFVHPDGKHLVRIGPWPRLGNPGQRLYDELAIAFYRNGNELEKYAVKDLVSNPQSLPVSKSHYEWRKDISFDEPKGILSLVTKSDESYEFKVSEMSPENNSSVINCNPNALYKYNQELKYTLLILAGLAPISLAGILLIRRMAKAKNLRIDE